ncbi:MAG: hypothetical protein AVDCRST_MAG73-2939 [uncultured Thermomicrobiales bacterium]|uniref:Uncharacterized protein n=1 Tax=uncultured Thermomicrobiales bacterium TaxID=1645740 RepID=A0A6J4UME2_9BACT|nr:MAG: hypothetical protein AVDCRST_MAG73-2939 [uncultured Thermomicrobiales bacterium]
MLFGRVEGVAEPANDGGDALRVIVTLETGQGLRVVRDDVLAPVRPLKTMADAYWHADQWTQETIGTTLAEEGWEVVGAGEPPEPRADDVPRSSTYAVRKL